MLFVPPRSTGARKFYARYPTPAHWWMVAQPFLLILAWLSSNWLVFSGILAALKFMVRAPWLLEVLGIACRFAVPTDRLFLVAFAFMTMVPVSMNIGIFVIAWRMVAWPAWQRLTLGRCGACAHPIASLSSQTDGCTVCPECGAAWRLKPAASMA